jgi:MoaA/NifB/PqqE/SkfB family radical SAM enzyme
MANLGYIQLVRVCNQQCRFCSNPETDYKLPVEDAMKKVDDLRERGYDGIILTGGEPTMCPYLEELIAYATSRGVASRMITNGQKTADPALVERLVAAGLKHVHVSVHSHDAKVQAELTGNPDSLPNIEKSLENFHRAGVNADVNITIQAYNGGSLDRVVGWLVSRFPHLRHFVFNFLDPTSDRVAVNRDTIPKLADVELSLHRALTMLHKSRRTFRVERVPLCYMAEFAWASTETRKIVKEEERIVHFLDQRGMVRQTTFRHGKADVCKVCLLEPICAGLFEMDTFYQSAELYPVFLPPGPIIKRIKESD